MTDTAAQLQKRFLKQQNNLLIYSLVTSMTMFIAITCSQNWPAGDTAAVHRYQLSLYVAFLLDFTALMGLLCITITASFLPPWYLPQLAVMYRSIYVPVCVCLIVAGGFFGWSLWELARVYEHTLGNPLFSQCLALIPIGGFALVIVWMTIFWFYPVKEAENSNS